MQKIQARLFCIGKIDGGLRLRIGDLGQGLPNPAFAIEVPRFLCLLAQRGQKNRSFRIELRITWSEIQKLFGSNGIGLSIKRSAVFRGLGKC